jgi:RsiW-degrading membrane proteinase PrsW (M82 family)
VLAWLRTLRDLFRAFVPSRDARALTVEILGIVAISLALGLVLHHRVPASPPWAGAQALARRGDLSGAEEVYWAHIRRGPVTVPLLLDFLDNHATLAVVSALSEAPSLRQGPRAPLRLVVADQRIERLFADARLPRPVALAGRYYWEARRGDPSEAIVEQVSAAADRAPPTPWANHVLGRVAVAEQRLDEAAARFEREGLHFQGRQEDLRRALQIWIAQDDWDTVAARIADRRWAPAVDPWVRHEVALHEGQWADAARWLLLETLDPEIAPLLLALVAGLMWFLFVARLGKLGERPRFRGALFALAFVLGVLSIAPTLLLITVEEHFLHLEETGDIVKDAIYFVAGVGLREELAKLLLFAPLLPILRRYGGKLDVLACGAMVGLGFAAEENLNYFAGDAGASAVGRFLTANFMHMSMTALCADALDHFLRDPGRRSMDFSVTFLTVVALHGAYDFFSANPAVGDLSFLSVVVFVLLTRNFLAAVRQARGRSEPHDKFLRRLVQAVAVVAGASFVYACAEVGPGAAATMLAVGLLGDAIIIYVFVHETRHA